MCGACGRTVVADEALGPVRTRRQLLRVASAVNALRAGLPGVPGVQAAGDAWTLRAATGAVRSCSTVHELWAAVAAGSPPGSWEQLTARLAAQRPAAVGLDRDVIDAGLRLARTAD
jgi:hypothetical protein